MDVSSSPTNTTSVNTALDATKKALESDQQMVSKLVQSQEEQAKTQQSVQETQTAQKTGMGNSLDLLS